jgi:hypothetical protein
VAGGFEYVERPEHGRRAEGKHGQGDEGFEEDGAVLAPR